MYVYLMHRIEKKSRAIELGRFNDKYKYAYKIGLEDVSKVILEYAPYVSYSHFEIIYSDLQKDLSKLLNSKFSKCSHYYEEGYNEAILAVKSMCHRALEICKTLDFSKIGGDWYGKI